MTAAGQAHSRPPRIALTVDLAAGQTLASYLSALASRNGLRSIDRFCVAFCLDAQRLRAGDPDALLALADLIGIAQERLLAAVMRRQPPILQGEPVDGRDLGAPVRVCPQCLAEDHAEQPRLRFETAARYRGAWVHHMVRACAVHDLELVALPEHGTAKEDLALQLRNLAKSGVRLTEVPLPATRVERYIQNRLGAERINTPFLDAMQLSDALFVCEYLGAPHRAAVKPRLAADLRERLNRANLGFSIAARGAEAVRARLNEIAVTVNPFAAAEIGLRRVFMGLFERVRDRTGDDMRTLRQMLVDIGARQCLIAFEQTEALGLPVPPRDRQSIESAVRKFGVSDRELRAILVELKAIPSDDAGKPANTVLFEVGEVSDLLSKISSSLNLAEAARLLGVHTQQLVRISEAGLLAPFFVRPSNDLKPLRYYQRSDLEQFMARLTAGCRFARQKGDLVDIWQAGLKTCRQPMEIIASIHVGKIRKTYRTRRKPTIRDILVNVADVQAGMMETSGELVTAEDCSRILTINLNAIRKILHAGFLAAETSINPVNQRRQLAARRDAVEAFQRQFVSLNGLRQELNASSAGLARILHTVGLRPAFPVKVSDVSIYRRSDLAKAQTKIEHLLCGSQLIGGRAGRALKGRPMHLPRFKHYPAEKAKE